MYKIIFNTVQSIRDFGVQGENIRIENITTDEAEIQALAELLNTGDVAEIHVYDVIENWFGEKVYAELGI